MKRVFALLILFVTPAVASSQNTPREPAATAGLHRIDPRTPQGLQKLLARTEEPLPLVSAHRGGPRKGFPENCLATFEETLRHTFALLEIDPRYTKDGAVVLHHDATLERTTTGRGHVSDLTLAGLKRLRLKDPDGRATDFEIPTLDEALRWARGKTVLVLDQKDVPVGARVRMIEKHQAESYAMLIVNSFQDAQACHALNKDIAMEVMIPNLKKAQQFDRLGVPWQNVVAFVGHIPPEDRSLYEFLHGKGACAMIGTSRNLDRQFLTGQVDLQRLEPGYRDFLRRGADIIETDIPIELGRLLYASSPPPSSKKDLFVAP